MSLPIKTLPIDERWQCTGCGLCCRGNVVPLDDRDLQKLRDQAWDQHPDFQGIQTVVRESVSGKSYRLAQRDDGSCVFLLPDGLCAIHKAYGLAAKPVVCQTYPLQLIPLDGKAVLTLRRSCPSAATDAGPPLEDYRSVAGELGKQRGLLDAPSSPPRISKRQRGDWHDVKLVTDTIGRMLRDERFPLVRRLVHTSNFCDLLAACRPKQAQRTEFRELLDILSESSIASAGEVFRDRLAPSAPAAVLFRQVAAEYLRLHKDFQAKESWSHRWKMTKMAWKMARGKGTTPLIHADFPAASFESLELPIGHLAEEIQRPLNRYFEVNGATGQYSFASKPTWTILESCRALILTYPVALWILRLCSQGREPSAEDAVEMVTIIDRGQGYRPLLGRQHRRRVATLSRLEQLSRLVVWYAR